MAFGFGKLPIAPPAPAGMSAEDFAAILAAAQPGAAGAPRPAFGFGPLAPPAGAPAAMPATSGAYPSVASMFEPQGSPQADVPDAGAAPIMGQSPLAPVEPASFDERFNQAPAGQGYGVQPKAVAAMRSGLLRQAPGGVVPLPSEAPPADVPATGSVPIMGEAPAAAPRSAPPLSFGPLPGTQARTAPQAASTAPAGPAEIEPDGNGFLSALGRPGVYNTLLGIGQGLLSTKGFGPGIAAGTAYASRLGKEQAATDLAQAEYGLKARKLQQEAAGQNATVEMLVRGGHPHETATAMVQAAAAGNREALSNALQNIQPKNAEVPWSYQRNTDGSVRATVGGSDDPNTLRARAQAQAEGAAAGKPDEPYNLSPGQTRFDASGNPIVSVPDRSKALEQSGSIRKEIHTLPSYKNYSQALPVYQGMVETADRDSKASDLNLIYGLGKIMDPGSVVREGELRLAQDTQGVADKLIGMYNSVTGAPGSRHRRVSSSSRKPTGVSSPTNRRSDRTGRATRASSPVRA